jgi:2-oxoisovalerate dehydrogenase E2 component (dihydrolipoyl transacylase)
MSTFTFRLPDLGEGTVAAEIVAWLVKPGDAVTEGQPIAEMSTDKAVVELPSPVTGRVVARQGQPGDSVAVGSDLISFEVGEASAAQPVPAAGPPAPAAAAPASTATAPRHAAVDVRSARGAANATPARVMASPATRRRAREAGIDLATLAGSGPGGRIEKHDLERATPQPVPALRADTEEIKVIGVRRVIAQRMSEAKRTIPHFSYIEEVDVTELESLRQHLNAKRPSQDKLSLLPFVIAALVRVLDDFPQCNAHYDGARETIVRYRGVHVGIATQTQDGLKVPVVRDAGSLPLNRLAAEIRRVAEAARTNRATREMLSGSTITVTSLGKLGGIASTPVINAPEVAIIGVNRMVERPVVRHGAVAIRWMMNLSSSFDHRFVDGFDAAAMIQALRDRLEHPATIFLARDPAPSR